jgi:hypothetical protein
MKKFMSSTAVGAALLFVLPAMEIVFGKLA